MLYVYCLLAKHDKGDKSVFVAANIEDIKLINFIDTIEGVLKF